MSKMKKGISIAAGILLALVIFASTILPAIVRSKAVEAISQATGRKAYLESMAINPLTLTVTGRKLNIEGTDGSPFISVGQLRASLSSASIFRRALVLDEVTIDTPSISFSRTAPHQYSFSDILERQKKESKPDSQGQTRFSINNIRVTNGSIDFNDQAVADGRKHTVRKLEIAVPFISNIPYMVDRYIDPKLSAIVNDAPFSVSGKTKPLSKSMETSMHIALDQLNLPPLIAYVPQKLPVQLTSGSLTSDINVSYLVSKDKKPELNLSGLIRLNDLNIEQNDHKPLLKLPVFEIKAIRADLLNSSFNLDSVTLEQLELYLSRDARGKWMYEQFLPASRPRPETKALHNTTGEAAKPTEQPLVQVAKFNINNGQVHFRDDVPTGGFKGEASEIDISIKDFSTAAGKTASYELSILFDNESTLNADGTLSLSPLKVTASNELSDVNMQRGWPYLSQIMTAPVKGTATISSEATYTSQDGVLVEHGSFIAERISTRYGSKEGIDIGRFEVGDARYSQKENSLTAALILLSRADIKLSREKDGSISLLSLIRKPAQARQSQAAQRISAPAARKSAAQDTQKTARDFSFRFKQIQLERFNSSFTDKSMENSPRFSLRNTSLKLSDLSGPRFTPVKLAFSSMFNKNTPIKANGSITPYPFRYKGNISIGRLPIRDFEAYFPPNINVFILSGLLDTSTTIDLAIKDGRPVGSFSGSAGVRSFHCIDSIAEEDLLTWESLQLDEIAGRLEPFSLSIRQVALNNAFSRIIIRKDGTLNLQNLVAKPAIKSPKEPISAAQPQQNQPKTASQTTATAVQLTSQTAPAARPPVSIGSITIQDGTISFTDNHLPQQFATTFYNLGGRVSGLTSEESKFAEVDLRGNLENHSPLQISGKINPLRDDLFVDLIISFKDIDLTPATPYSGTYLGYAIDKGKLFLDLKYLIDKKQLTSQNRVFVDQFTFGKEVQSTKATSLPVRLAVALLKDRKGEIHLDLPVTGRTDDPKFSIWGVVWQVVKNLFVKAATSPFALLSSIFGGGEDFSTISFDSGLSRLSAAEEKKLSALAKTLIDRPALKLEIKGYVDRDKDTEGYRQELLNQKLRQEKFLALAKDRRTQFGDKAENIEITQEELPKYMKAVYAKEKFPKPRNMFGFIKDLPVSEMKKLIIANTKVTDNDLHNLARERAVTVMNFLVAPGGLPSERLFQKMDDIFKAPEKDTAAKSRVEFTAIAK